MKQKLFIFILLILMAVVLVGLNAASYQQKEKTPDSELVPNRSSFNAGAAGTQAFFTLLNETGRGPLRWQEPPAALITARKKPGVFVVIGEVRRPYTDQETIDLLQWVATGGRLVLIDRNVPEALAVTTASWKLSVRGKDLPDLLTVDSSDQGQMTKGVAGVRPAQPSVLTQSVNAIQPSRFAGSVSFERFIDPDVPRDYDEEDAPPPPKVSTPGNATVKPMTVERSTGQVYQMPSPTPFEITTLGGTSVESPSQMAPVVHFADGANNLVVEVPYGEGKIVFLTDPFIVSNAGISMVDNAQLAINLVAAGQGAIAFDEYHQGYGSDNNRFLQFFAGTPVVAIFLQLILIVGLVFFSQSRRFARPVPEPEEDRLSKLEYIAAMAELQSRTKAYDLAVENIYTDFRRRVGRVLGLDFHSLTGAEMSAVVAERTGADRQKIAETFSKCENIIHGEPTNKREVLQLVEELRKLEIEMKLVRSFPRPDAQARA